MSAAAVRAMSRELAWRRIHELAVVTTISRMGHDLRGLLAPAMLVAERLQMSEEPTVRRSGDTLLRSVERATERLRHGVELAREGRPAFARAPVPLAELVKDGHALSGAGRDLAVVYAHEPEITVVGDRELFAALLAELFRNAQQAGARRLVVEVAASATEASITLTDDGCGFSPSAQAQAFAPDLQGARFGLAIVRDAARAHEGQAMIEASDAGGATMRLIFPRGVVRLDSLR